MDLKVELYSLGYLAYLQFKQIFLWWIAGVAVGSVVSVFASSWIERMAAGLAKGKYLLVGILSAALLGVASPVCMYGTVPLIASLGKKGVPHCILSAFMVSSILLNPNLLLFSFALGTPLALARLGFSLLAGVTAGALTAVFMHRKGLYQFESFEPRKKKDVPDNRLIAYLQDFKRGIAKTAPYFFIGIALTALFDRYFPKDLLVNLFGSDNGLGVLFATAIGVPVYVCGGGTIPLLKSWLDMGMTPGAAMAFMISGPASKLTNLSAVKMILGFRNFLLYMVFSILFAFAAGLLTDAIASIL